jgi:hypothetical protein
LRRIEHWGRWAVSFGLCVACGGESAAGDSTKSTSSPRGTEPEPVRIIRGAPEDEFWDLTIWGEALDEYEGKLVTVRMGWPDRAPERLVSGGARIENGTFELVFPAAWERDLYKTKLVLIDVNGDHACDLAIDRLFGDSRATYADAFVVNLGSARSMHDMVEMDDAFYCEWFNSEWPLE